MVRRAVLLLGLVACDAPVYYPSEPPPKPVDTGVDPVTTGTVVTTSGGVTTTTTGGSTLTVDGLKCSRESVQPTTIEVRNMTPAPVDFFWLDFGCNELFLRTLPPASSTVEYSFATHTFVVRDPGGALLGALTLDASAGQILEVTP